MLAQLTSYLVNFSYRAPRQATAPRDFMPSQWAKGSAPRKRSRMTRQRRLAVAAAIRNFFPPPRA